MKKNATLLLLVLLVFGAMSCKSDEQLRVEEVIAPYAGTKTCTTTNLVGRANPTTVTDSSLVCVTKPKDFENGFIGLLDQATFLNDKLEFTISTSNYYLTGKFDGPSLNMTEDKVDQDAQQRVLCAYSLSKQ